MIHFELFNLNIFATPWWTKIFVVTDLHSYLHTIIFLASTTSTEISKSSPTRKGLGKDIDCSTTTYPGPGSFVPSIVPLVYYAKYVKYVDNHQEQHWRSHLEEHHEQFHSHQNEQSWSPLLNLRNWPYLLRLPTYDKKCNTYVFNSQ